MTFKEARDAIARNEGHADWLTCVFRENLTSILLLDEKAAELYARYKWDECNEKNREELAFLFANAGGTLSAYSTFKNLPKPEFKP